MAGALRIGNAHGFWGDRLDAAAEMLALQPDLDYLTLDLLAEVSMSVLALQRQRDPQAGFVADVLEIIESLVPYWQRGGQCRLITNGGGLDPASCGQQVRRLLDQHNCGHLTIAVISGDDVLDELKQDCRSGANAQLGRNLDSGQPLSTVVNPLMTANAYIGAAPIVAALRRGADLVIAGRVADPSLTVAPCVHHFGWSADDWDRIAGATVAGHLIECGTQVTGGIATDWLEVPELDRIGFPIVEVDDDGSCVVTKPGDTGGCVSEATVKEQLLYEIGDPGQYLSPDVTVSFLNLHVQREARNRVRVRGAAGRPPPSTLKVSATYHDGYRATGQLTVFGDAATTKASRAGQMLLARLARNGIEFRDSLVELVGTGACDPARGELQFRERGSLDEITLRISVADPSRESVEQFARSIMSLITAGPPGTTGYAEGRPRVRPLLRFWPCLIDRPRVRPDVQMFPGTGTRPAIKPPSACLPEPDPVVADRSDQPSTQPLYAGHDDGGMLIDVAHARSGDKGAHANIGVIARRAKDYDELKLRLSCERVARHLGIDPSDRITRFELPNLAALNFVVRDALNNPLRLDVQGKALAQVLLQMPW